MRDFLPPLLRTIPDTEEFPFQWPPRYNIAPTQMVLTVHHDAEAPTALVEPLRWGLVPFWAKDLSIGNRMINARSETAAEKPSFRAAMKRRRCLIPADGYYEWQKVGSKKQPFYIHHAEDRTFAMAGLYEENTKASEDGSPVRTCTILTTAANSVTGRVHERMPCIIEAEDVEQWLDPDNDDSQEVSSLLRPAAEEAMTMHAVDRAVGNVRNEGPSLIRPVASDA